MEKLLVAFNDRVRMSNWISLVCLNIQAVVIVGGITRLTRSGLSISYWKPTKVLPPISEQEWQLEFADYKQHPEYKYFNHDMSLEQYKMIFYPEYFHRILARTTFLCAFVPLVYYRKSLTPFMRWRLTLCTSLIVGQGALGWYMVQSGLKEDLDSKTASFTRNQEVKVSPLRLGAHLTCAFTIYSLFITKLFKLSIPPDYVNVNPTILKKMSRISSLMTACFFATFFSGAIVAGTRAGFVDFKYNLNYIKNYFNNQYNHQDLMRTIQLAHRSLVFLSSFSLLYYIFYLRNNNIGYNIGRYGYYMLGGLVIQALLGQYAVNQKMERNKALLHHGGALLMLNLVMLNYSQVGRCYKCAHALSTGILNKVKL